MLAVCSLCGQYVTLQYLDETLIHESAADLAVFALPHEVGFTSATRLLGCFLCDPMSSCC